MVRAYGLTDRGVARRRNEDHFAIAEDLQAFVVADGMGGHAAGDVASRLAVETVLGYLRRTHGDPGAQASEFDWPFEYDDALSRDGNRLKTAVRLANRRIFGAAGSQPEYSGMGTTIVCALISGTTLVAAHVGDSRLYLRDGAGLVRLTRDDSWLETFGQDPAACPGGQAARGNLLTNALGVADTLNPSMLERPLCGGELLLLCTDGIHGVLDDDAVRRCLDATPELRLKVKSLVVAALYGQSTDNVTALVVRFDPDGAPGPAEAGPHDSLRS